MPSLYHHPHHHAVTTPYPPRTAAWPQRLPWREVAASAARERLGKSPGRSLLYRCLGDGGEGVAKEQPAMGHPETLARSGAEGVGFATRAPPPQRGGSRHGELGMAVAIREGGAAWEVLGVRACARREENRRRICSCRNDSVSDTMAHTASRESPCRLSARTRNRLGASGRTWGPDRTCGDLMAHCGI